MYIVYETMNLVNEKIYVGVHAIEDPDVFDGYLGSGQIIKDAIKKYGEDKFQRKVLSIHEESEGAFLKEREIVDQDFVDRDDTYNLRTGGLGCGSGKNSPMFGKHHSEETKKKISVANSGENGPMFGKHHSEEAKKRIGAARVGKPRSDEMKKKLSDVAKLRVGEKNGMFGKRHSIEARKKMSEALKGRVFSDETLKNMSAASKLKIGEKNGMFGKHHSEEAKKKISEALSGEKNHNYGKKLSRATRKKISETKLMPGILDQRFQDIKNIIKTKGWKLKLSKEWGISYVGVYEFINRHASEILDRNIDITFTERIYKSLENGHNIR